MTLNGDTDVDNHIIFTLCYRTAISIFFNFSSNSIELGEIQDPKSSSCSKSFQWIKWG